MFFKQGVYPEIVKFRSYVRANGLATLDWIIKLSSLTLETVKARTRVAFEKAFKLMVVELFKSGKSSREIGCDVSILTHDLIFEERGSEMFANASRRTDWICFEKWNHACWEKVAYQPLRALFPFSLE